MATVDLSPGVAVCQQKVVLMMAHLLVRVPDVVHTGLHSFFYIAP